MSLSKVFKTNIIGLEEHTCVWVHAKHAMLIPADDAVRDFSVGLCVSAGCLHSEQLCAHCHILRHGSSVFTVLKHWRIVVDVQDRNYHLAQRGEMWGALVTGAGLQLICRLNLAVQWTLQAYYTGVLVN